MANSRMTVDMLQEALDAYQRFEGSRQKAAKALGLSESALGNRVRLAKEQGLVVRESHAPRAERTGRSLDEFRAQHDKGFIIPRKIDEALQQLGEGWEYEVGFAKLAGIGLQDLSAFRDKYAAHIVVLNRDGRRAWAGTKETAQKMREMLS